MPTKILIADDHEVIRLGLKAMLRDTDFKITVEAASGDEAVRAIKHAKVDLALLDVRMDGGDGLNALGRIKLSHQDLPVVLFSAYNNSAYVARAVALGAAGYLLKDIGRKKLIAALNKVAKGGTLWTREEELRRFTGALATPRISLDEQVPLTPRECEVLKLVATGDTNKQIAVTLKISYETVKEHVQHILRKIGVTDRTQAALWSVRQGMV